MPGPLIASVSLMVPSAVAVLPAAATTPTPSASPDSGLGSAGSGPGFVVLAVILVAALLFSTWRLRRGR